MEGEEARGKMAEEGGELGMGEGVGRQKGNKVGERGLRERREEEEAGEMGRGKEEKVEKGSREADGQGWASLAAHNPATP